MDSRTTPAAIMSERRVSIIGAMLAVIGPISMALYTPAMPELVRAFGTTDAVIKLTLSLYFFGFAFTQLIAGPLSDALGRRPVSLAFIAIYLVASIAAALSPRVDILLVARLAQGIGASVGIATSRSIVRDLFTGEQSSRIMNLIGLLLAIGPAIAPTVGGLMLIVASWRAIFMIMVAAGAALMLVIIFAMRETGHPDRALLRPWKFISSYALLLRSAHFLTASLAIGGSVGAIYTLATILPFVLVNEVGMSPQAFGIGMVAQTGSYFVGSLIARAMMRRLGADAIVPLGVAFMLVGAALIAVLSFAVTPTYLTVMGPVGVYAFGIAFIMPAMTTAALHPFPAIAGAASALMGFIQMGSGFAGGAVAALFIDPLVAMGIVIPGLATIATAGYLAHRAVAARTPKTAEPRGKLLP